MENDNCYQCQRFIAIDKDGQCDIYGIPNHGISYCKDFKLKENEVENDKRL